MPNPSLNQILANLPAGTQRVQVVDASGKTKWRAPDQVRKSDVIAMKGGAPVVMRGAPGRPARVELPPASDEVGEVCRQKKEAIRDDDLRGKLARDPNQDVLPVIMQGIAEEAASLKFEREEAERQGEQTAMISSRRVRALTALGDAWVKRMERTATIDLEGDQFKLLFRFVLETFRAVLEDSGVRPELVETIFTRMGEKLDDAWKAEARAKMRGKS